MVPDNGERVEPIAEGPSPNNPPWTTPVAIALWFVSVLLIFLLPSLFVLPYAFGHQIDFADSKEFAAFLTSDPTAILLSIVAVIPAHLITIGLAWALVTRRGKFSFTRTLGWKFGGIPWWVCLLSFMAIVVAFFVLEVLLGTYFPEKENDLARILRSSQAAVYLVAFLATFTAPIVEEVVYRGVVYSALQRTAGVAFGIAATTMLFAMVHVPQYYPSYSTIFLLTLLSLTLTLVRYRTSNLLPCIILHFIFNGLQSIVLVFQSFLPKSITDVPDPTSFISRFF